MAGADVRLDEIDVTAGAAGWAAAARARTGEAAGHMKAGAALAAAAVVGRA